jgi:hypothetical protein
VVRKYVVMSQMSHCTQLTMYEFFCFKFKIKTKADSYMPCKAMAHKFLVINYKILPSKVLEVFWSQGASQNQSTKIFWCHSICRCLPKCQIHQMCHGHRAIPNRSKLYCTSVNQAISQLSCSFHPLTFPI